MNDDQRRARLEVELSGCGAQVDGPYNVWALDAAMTDHHLQRLATWADLEILMAAGCPITGNGLTSICSFHRLKSLDIGRTKITASALATSDLPKELQSLGVYEIQLTDEAVKRIASLTALRMLNCNHSGLTLKQFEILADLPKLKGFEALGCPVPAEVAIAVSRRRPQGVLRLDSGVWKNGELIRSRQTGLTEF